MIDDAIYHLSQALYSELIDSNVYLKVCILYFLYSMRAASQLICFA